MSSPFPLLRLPRVVLFEVFKSLNIREKIRLSHCSRKISIQINSARLYSQKVIVVLDCLKRKIRVRSENDKDAYAIFISIKNRKGFSSFIQHILKMFPCKISTRKICYHSDLFQPVISELLDQQVKFKALTILLTQNLLFEQISNDFGLVENLRIISVANPGFRPVFSSWPQKISIKSSYWFTLESLLACTCTSITLEESRLENEDLDEVLKNWKAGGFPNLKYLNVHSLRSTNDGEHILGMNLRELDGMTIQNDDGSKNATIQLSSHCIEMSVTPFQ
ncbi:hypothetical protein CRE_05249 [Caenorhabditis remanei]|uniref:F-box domain-containing protein n=1 Tax=Caenorhabditis remanei TaxID=31234 RepID=E3NID4_CAERE|nr:hypothetical protein CRE_05249 [Caenorhabditis remanei]